MLGEACAVLMRIHRRLLNGDKFPRVSELEYEVCRKVRSIIDGLMEEYLSRIRKKIWCDKSPANVGYIDDIMGIFPDAKFVCLYRDCLDTVASSIDAGRYGYMVEQQAYVLHNPGTFVKAMIENWADKTERIIQAERSSALAVRVRYEDIVGYPDRALKPIISFLGLDWSDRVITEVFTANHYVGGGDTKIRSKTTIHTDSVGLGRTLALSQVPANLVVRANSLQRQLGYEPINKPREQFH